MFCFWLSASAFSLRLVCTFTPAIGCEAAMSFDLILGGVISVGMFVYLVFALLRPEKF
jgi:K+-transporting ATPase KdpF subunit